jgi:outer membrane lipoprotein-sorting protein
MKRKILAALLLSFIPFGVFAYNFEFVTVSDVVKKVQEKFASFETYQANFSIISDKMDKKKVQQGVISYKASNKLLVNFTTPPGQKIVSDDKTMWIYIPSMNVVAQQDLKNDSGVFSVQSKTGLRRLFSKYHYRFDGKEQPAVQSDGSKQYTIFLKQKESRSGFSTMKLWVSEDYVIVRAEGETSSGKKVSISFSQIKTGIDLPNGMFKFDVPGQARVIKNPMIAEE